MPKSMDSNLSTFFLNDIRIIQASSLSPSLYLEPYTHEVHHSLIQTHTFIWSRRHNQRLLHSVLTSEQAKLLTEAIANYRKIHQLLARWEQETAKEILNPTATPTVKLLLLQQNNCEEISTEKSGI
jgi:hypothetical protein